MKKKFPTFSEIPGKFFRGKSFPHFRRFPWKVFHFSPGSFTEFPPETLGIFESFYPVNTGSSRKFPEEIPRKFPGISGEGLQTFHKKFPTIFLKKSFPQIFWRKVSHKKFFKKFEKPDNICLRKYENGDTRCQFYGCKPLLLHCVCTRD